MPEDVVQAGFIEGVKQKQGEKGGAILHHILVGDVNDYCVTKYALLVVCSSLTGTNSWLMLDGIGRPWANQVPVAACRNGHLEVNRREGLHTRVYM